MADENGNGGDPPTPPVNPPPGLTEAEFQAMKDAAKKISDILQDVALRYGYEYDEDED